MSNSNITHKIETRDRVLIRERKHGFYLKEDRFGIDWVQNAEEATNYKTPKTADKRALRYMRKQNFACREVEVVRSITVVETMKTTTVEMPETVVSSYDLSLTPE